MQVDRPDKGTGAPKRPTLPPKKDCTVDGRKNSRIAGGLSAFVRAVKPGCPMWGSERIMGHGWPGVKHSSFREPAVQVG